MKTKTDTTAIDDVGEIEYADNQETVEVEIDDLDELPEISAEHRNAMMKIQWLEGWRVVFLDSRRSAEWNGRRADVIRFHPSETDPTKIDVTLRYEGKFYNVDILEFRRAGPQRLERFIHKAEKKSPMQEIIEPKIIQTWQMTTGDLILWTIMGLVTLFLFACISVEPLGMWVQEAVFPREKTIEELMEANGLKITAMQTQRRWKGTNIDNLEERGLRDGYPRKPKGKRPERIDDLMYQEPKQHRTSPKELAETRLYYAKKQFKTVQKESSKYFKDERVAKENGYEPDEERRRELATKWLAANAKVKNAEADLKKYE